MNDPAPTTARAAFEFLVTDLDLAMTFLDAAKTSPVAKTRARNLANATEAYETVKRFAGRQVLDAEELQVLEGRLRVLEEELGRTERFVSGAG